MKRRHFVSLLSGALVALAALPKLAMAWPKAFSATTSEGAMAQLFPGLKAVSSDLVTLKAPSIAENGAVVPITVSTDLADVTNISILVNENPNPLAASFDLTPASIPEVSTRLKMGKTTMVTALVAAGGKLYSVEQEVKVTIGGCGG
jgi:sulfur-oxidizing protein SoxY